MNPQPDQSLERMRRLEELIHKIDEFTDPAVRAHIQELVQTLMDFHGEGVARMLDHLRRAGGPGQGILINMAGDEVVGSLLLLYGLHPLDTETRVRQALERIRPALQMHGGQAELVGVLGGAARVRILETDQKESSAALVLKQLVEEAIVAVAPEVDSVRVESAGLPAGNRNGRLMLPTV
jgi:Fe-S cluster biogenesis protein NfuA